VPVEPPLELLPLLELTQAPVRLAANTPKSPRLVALRTRLLFCRFALYMRSLRIGYFTVGNRVQSSWKCIHPACGRTLRDYRRVPMRQKWYYSYIGFVNDSLGTGARGFSDVGKVAHCERTARSTRNSRHLPAGNGGNPGTAWLVRSTDIWPRPMPLAVSVIVPGVLVLRTQTASCPPFMTMDVDPTILPAPLTARVKDAGISRIQYSRG
jgi:hypothetical protein